MTFYKEKGWYKSKTIVTSIVGAIGGILLLFGIPLPVDPATAAGWWIVGITFLTGLFRTQAESTVTLT